MFSSDLQLETLSLWRSLLDVVLVAVIIYQLLLLLKGSRSGAALFGVALIFGMFYLSQDDVVDLPTLNWLLDRFISSIVVLLVVLFQDDIRRALASTMRSPLVFSSSDPASSAVLGEVLRATAVLSQRCIGALVVIEQEADLDRYVEHGVRVDADVSWQLLTSLFIPSHMNPTHDGAVIIQKGRIASAACFLPLAFGDDIPANMGSRHRAALGLADETDAIVVVVSEESGRCAIAHMGQIDLELKPTNLRDRFRVLFGERRDRDAWQKRWQRRIVHHAPTEMATRSTGEYAFDPQTVRERTVRDTGELLRKATVHQDATVELQRPEADPKPEPPPEPVESTPEPQGAPPEPALEPLVIKATPIATPAVVLESETLDEADPVEAPSEDDDEKPPPSNGEAAEQAQGEPS